MGVQDVECGLAVEGRVRDKGVGEDLIEVQIQPLGFFSLRFVHICGSEDGTLNCQLIWYYEGHSNRTH